MNRFDRGMIIDVNLDPLEGSETGKIRPAIIVTNNIYNRRLPVLQVVPVTAWSRKKALIRTNVELNPNEINNLSKRSIADCLQTRPIDHRRRLKGIRGRVSAETLERIDQSLRTVFGLR